MSLRRVEIKLRWLKRSGRSSWFWYAAPKKAKPNNCGVSSLPSTEVAGEKKMWKWVETHETAAEAVPDGLGLRKMG